MANPNYLPMASYSHQRRCNVCSEIIRHSDDAGNVCDYCQEEQRISWLEDLADKRVLMEAVLCNHATMRLKRHAYMKMDIKD